MNTQFTIKENWLTHKPREYALFSSLVFAVLLVVFSYFYLNGILFSDQWMAASRETVFNKHEYWRLWSTLFAHADIEHLLSNLLLLIPLSFLLTGFFGILIFPIVGVIVGGLINFIVLKFLPVSVSLIGISGLVYWMGAVWLTLYMLIDRRKHLRYRIAIAIFLTVVLFLPETYRPEVSYLSHLVGYLLGVGFGIIYYFYRRVEFKSAEVIEIKKEDVELSYLDIEALAAGKEVSNVQISIRKDHNNNH